MSNIDKLIGTILVITVILDIPYLVRPRLVLTEKQRGMSLIDFIRSRHAQYNMAITQVRLRKSFRQTGIILLTVNLIQVLTLGYFAIKHSRTNGMFAFGICAVTISSLWASQYVQGLMNIDKRLTGPLKEQPILVYGLMRILRALIIAFVMLILLT